MPRFGPQSARQPGQTGTTGRRWAALAEAGKVVAMLAGVVGEENDQAARSFPALIRNADFRQQRLADNGCADLAAIMEPGISALLAIHARGADCRPAARALWQEFTTARGAMLALLPPNGELGPRRSA
jgi:hypothetical protein